MSPAGVLCLLLAIGAEPIQTSEPLTLEAATEIALAHANEMIQAREDVLLIDADYAAALSTILPRVDIAFSSGGFYSDERIIETRNVGAPVPQGNELPAVEFGPFRDFDSNSFLNPQLSLSLSARQLIFDGGRWWTALGQVDDRRRSREADLSGVENLVRAGVARTFFGLERARQAKLAIEAQVDVDRAQVERARALLSVGRGSPADVATARRNLASDQASLVAAETTEGQANRAFNLQLGRAPGTRTVLILPAALTSSSAPARYVPPMKTLHALTVENRPELTSARATVAEREKAVTIERAAYWPSLAVSASYDRSSRRIDRVFNNPEENFTATFDLSMDWNLFQGFATDAAVERAQIEVRKERAAYQNTERNVLAEVEDSFQRLRNQERAIVFAREQVEAAEEAVRLARGLYEAGRGTSLELRDAELGLTRARLARINAQIDAAIAYADLTRSVGTNEWAVRQN